MTIFEVLADPTRRRIVDLLREQPRLVGELTALLDISQPGISKHLRVLRESGVVNVRQDAQRRWYELRAEPFSELQTWLDGFRHLAAAKYERLDRVLDELSDEETNDEQA